MKIVVQGCVVVDQAPVEPVVHIRVAVLLELAWRALVVVEVVAAVWLANGLGHAVLLEAATKLIAEASAQIILVSRTTMVLWLVEVAGSHAVLDGLESLLVARDFHSHSELLSALKVRLNILSVLILQDFLELLVLCHFLELIDDFCF